MLFPSGYVYPETDTSCAEKDMVDTVARFGFRTCFYFFFFTSFMIKDNLITFLNLDFLKLKYLSPTVLLVQTIEAYQSGKRNIFFKFQWICPSYTCFIYLLFIYLSTYMTHFFFRSKKKH